MAVETVATPTSLNFNDIVSTISPTVAGFDNKVRGLLDNPDPTAAELVDIQAAMQEWTLALNLQTTIIKTFHDSLNEIIQKTG